MTDTTVNLPGQQRPTQIGSRICLSLTKCKQNVHTVLPKWFQQYNNEIDYSAAVIKLPNFKCSPFPWIACFWTERAPRTRLKGWTDWKSRLNVTLEQTMAIIIQNRNLKKKTKIFRNLNSQVVFQLLMNKLQLYSSSLAVGFQLGS